MEGSCEECGSGKEVWGEGVGDVLRVGRLGWFGHVVRRGETEIWERLGVLWCRGSGNLEDLKRPEEEICKKNLQV